MEVREYMAQLGFRTFDEMVGHSERLEMRCGRSTTGRPTGLDFSRILFQPQVPQDDPSAPARSTRSTRIEESLDNTTLHPRSANLPWSAAGRSWPTFRSATSTASSAPALGSTITRRYGGAGLPEDTIKLNFRGSAGQSFGAFIPKGLTLTLEGDANDYLGKGLSGGKIVLFPPRESRFVAEDNIITGNVAFYGATPARLTSAASPASGSASATPASAAVVEGVGDHGCEYMTGGKVVIIGKTGRNFAAGMSGGVAYILDESGEGGAAGGGFERVCNKEMVQLFPLSDPKEAELVHNLLKRHVEYTGSTRARALLDAWPTTVLRFIRVVPNDYRRVIEAQAKMRETAASPRMTPRMAAFDENVLDARRVAGN